jgi:hypothetical protein
MMVGEMLNQELTDRDATAQQDARRLGYKEEAREYQLAVAKLGWKEEDKKWRRYFRHKGKGGEKNRRRSWRWWKEGRIVKRLKGKEQDARGMIRTIASSQ